VREVSGRRLSDSKNNQTKTERCPTIWIVRSDGYSSMAAEIFFGLYACQPSIT
jgi:hypothetical protein